MGHRTDPHPSLPPTLPHAHTGKWDPGLRLWLEVTEPKKLLMLEQQLGIEDHVGSSCL